MKKLDLIELAIKKMKSKHFENHKFPTTRRDFIKMGLLAGGGYLLPLTPIERALASVTAKAKPTLPFLVFDLQGGAALPANFLVGQAGGPEDLCADYRKHGWNPRAAEALDNTFGLPMANRQSRILAGLRETLPKEILKQGTNKMLQMASICHVSQDDNPTNRSSALTLVSKTGLLGSALRCGIGQRSTSSGGYSDVFLQDPQFRPKAISNLNDILNLTSLGDRFLELDEKTKQDIHNQLSEAGAKYPDLAQSYRALSEFGHLHNEGDPTKSMQMVKAYALEDRTSTNQLVQAGIAFNVLKKYTGPGVITIDGCDYHDNTQTTGDNKDFEIGQAIGRAIHAAHLLKQAFCFQIITDGGIYGPQSDQYERVWKGDANLHSLTILGFYNPNGNIQMQRLQLGHYTAEAQVQLDTFVGEKPENMVLAVIANYLYLNGLLDHFDELTGIRMQPDQLDELLIFG